MNIQDQLNAFCSPVSNFWLSDRTAVCQYHQNVTITMANATCHDHSGAMDFTLCFEDTAILYGICVIFSVLAGLSFLCGGDILKHASSSLSCGSLHVIKVVLLSIPILTALCELFYTIYQGRQMKVAPFQYVSPSVIVISMGISAIVQQNDRHLGYRTSGLMFLLWLSLAVYGTLKMRTYILKIVDQPDSVDMIHYSAFVFQYTTYVVELVLSVFPEPKPKRDSKITEESRRKSSPEEDATFLSQITWWWQNGQIWHGWRRTLTYDDLADLNSRDKSENVVPSFQKNWSNELKNPQKRIICKEPMLVWALAKTFGKVIVIAGIFKLLRDILVFVSPQLLKLMIKFTQDEMQPDLYGYIYAILLFVVELLKSLLLNQFFIHSNVVGMRIRTAIIAAVYRKSLHLSNGARRTTTVGEIVNLMSVDIQCISEFLPHLQLLWSAPLQVVVAIVSLYFTMGVSIFAGVGIMFTMIPLHACLGAWTRKLQVRQMMFKDTRTKIINEVLHGIKVIKLYVWEIPFQRMIFGIRKNESDKIRKEAYLKSIMFFIWNSTLFLVALGTFITYSFINTDQHLTADKAFVALSLFNLLRNPLSILPTLISNVVQVSVSITRLQRFLKADELDPNSVERCDKPSSDTESAVSITEGTFDWDGESSEHPTLTNINLQITPGQLVAVVGQVGAGKSSLIQAMLGEMKKHEGNITLKGSVAYVPQQAWIQNATLRDNILSESPLDNVKYERIIKACALLPDIEILPGGDLTEIGEKGINLSGGQKQRVSLARAVYQDCDIYFLDDPLSAVDAHVGKHIFEGVIGPQGILKNKTRLLVTHGIRFLPQCDRIIVMSNGVISEMGTYSELVEADGVFAQFLHTYQSTNQAEEKGCAVISDSTHTILHDDQPSGLQTVTHPPDTSLTSKAKLESISDQSTVSSDTEDETTERSALIVNEKVESGSVKLSVILDYCRACTWPMAVTTVVFFVLTHGASIASSFWLAKWSNAQANELAFKKNESMYIRKVTVCDDVSISKIGCYLGIYAGLGGIQSLFTLFSAITLAVASVLASKTLHSKLLRNIIRCPMSFFDTTPLGRVLNRFSLDIYVIDKAIPSTIQSFLYRALSVIGVILVISVATPTFIAVIIPLGIIYCIIQRFYMATSRQLKRLESISRSPIYSHFQETILGASSIRAYCQQDRFIHESQRRVDYNHLAYYPARCAERWLANWVKMIGNLVVLFAALFAAIQRNFRDEIDLPISAGLIGLSITYALEINQHLTYVLRDACDLETNFIAVERVKEYTEIATEAPAIIDNHRPPDDWPSKGHVKFEHYSTRYRKNLDLILRDICVDIPGGTKVGIVGRTGAGKSSLALAMFRIIESAGGAILVDGVNISLIGLDDLRSRITIIPQDPVLISGTLKMNLDPFGSYSDDEIWHALERAHLNSFVTSLENKLSHHITEYGDNLSVGQCQLICLARALLAKTKVLILDEATAAVDLETDDLIQKTIRSDFRDCTVITIAHRLNTVMDYDRIVVLDHGRIVEDGPPDELLSDRKSMFYSMAKEAGF